MWPAAPGGEGLSKDQPRHLRGIACRLGDVLAGLRARTGEPVQWEPGTAAVETPARSAAAGSARAVCAYGIAAAAEDRADSPDELAGRLLHHARGSSYRADDIALLRTEHGSAPVAT
ncbi:MULTISPECIES: hypothetical protein [Streptomyces]|uniref:Uncharacterized protein n=1 Tax=Streptomyces canarius TaxID=285453 RepID=A0ABQ3CHL7_9ACTN|nr:hypothetical protein [Streptomyces canarius]GHA16003.1 hypothetical protein GCM10010345_21020 [Streptomyces canarius]